MGSVDKAVLIFRYKSIINNISEIKPQDATVATRYETNDSFQNGWCPYIFVKTHVTQYFATALPVV